MDVRPLLKAQSLHEQRRPRRVTRSGVLWTQRLVWGGIALGIVLLVVNVALIGAALAFGRAQPDVGTLALVNPDQPLAQLYLVDVDDDHWLAAVDVSPDFPGVAAGLSLGNDGGQVTSPDGAHTVLVSGPPGARDLYELDVATGVSRHLTSHAADDFEPAWSPVTGTAGGDLVFVSTRDGNQELYQLDRRSGQTRNLTNHPGPDYSPVWSPDATAIAFVSTRDGDADVYLLYLDGGLTINLSSSDDDAFAPVWSPDGSHVAYVTRHVRAWAAHVIDIQTGARVTLAAPFGFYPVWVELE